MRKQTPSLVAAMIKPAIAGPSRRAPLNIELLSAIALGRSSRRSIISTTNACRAGASKALTKPCNRFSSTTCEMVIL
jgi:hypothetical protein